MIEMDRNILCFKRKDVWFADEPFDVKGFHQVTFHYCSKFVSLSGFQMSQSSTLGIDLTQDLKMIWENLNATTQYEITKAQKLGFIVTRNQGYQEFMELNRRFRKNKGLHSFEVSIDEMKRCGVLFEFFDGKIMQGGQFYLQDNTTMRLSLSVSRRLEIEKDLNKFMGYGNRLLVWEAICYAKETGKTFFDLGGYSLIEDDPQIKGINQFKKGFSNNICKRYRYVKTYSKVYQLARYIVDSFRAIVSSIFGKA